MRKAENNARRTIDQALQRVDERVVDLAEQSLFGELENCNLDVNTSIIHCAIGNDLHDLLSPILLHDTNIMEASEMAVILVATESAYSHAKRSRKLLPRDVSLLAPTVIFVVETINKAIACALKTETCIFTSSSSPSLSGSSSSSSEKNRQKKFPGASRKSRF